MLGLLLLTTVAPKHPPHWFDKLIAGYAFEYDHAHGQTGVYDPKSKFMLVRSIDCDGADVTLLLTRDRKEVNSMGYKVPGYVPSDPFSGGSKAMKVKALPSRSTGKGIAIGGSVQDVTTKLGKPSETTVSGSHDQFTNYTYKWTEKGGDEALEYEQTYTFKAGHLIEITFMWSPVDHETDPPAQKAAKKAQSDPRRS